MLCFEKKNVERLMDYTVISLTNPHTIRGRLTLKYVEGFRNGSFHEFCRLKEKITFKEMNTSNVEKKEESSRAELRWCDQKQQANRRKFNSPVQQPDSFPFLMMLDTGNEQFDISYIACVASVSVRFRSKEWGTRVKDRAKNGASKRGGRGWGRKDCFLPSPTPPRSCHALRSRAGLQGFRSEIR